MTRVVALEIPKKNALFLGHRNYTLHPISPIFTGVVKAIPRIAPGTRDNVSDDPAQSVFRKVARVLELLDLPGAQSESQAHTVQVANNSQAYSEKRPKSHPRVPLSRGRARCESSYPKGDVNNG